MNPLSSYAQLPAPLPEPLNRQLPPVYVKKWRLFGAIKEMRCLRRLEEDYLLPLPGDQGQILIPQGIEWDFASVPRCLWDRGFAPFELSPLATLLHDLLCDYEGCLPDWWWQDCEPREYDSQQAADLFLALMERQGINGRRFLAHRAVVRFGPKFDPRAPDDDPPAPGPSVWELFTPLSKLVPA